MNAPQELAVQISNGQGVTTSGTVLHQVWDKKDRTKRALKSLAQCWGGALVSVLIPLVHFVAVPSLLLAGPLLFFWRLTQKEVILGGKGQCPSCAKEFQIVRTKVQWPTSDICNHCKADLKIKPI